MKALEMGVCVHKGPILGGMGGHYFPRAFERRVRFLYTRRKFIEEFKRLVRDVSGNGQLSPLGPLLGNLEGIHLLGLLRG
jgi:hypothetical protein